MPCQFYRGNVFYKFKAVQTSKQTPVAILDYNGALTNITVIGMTHRPVFH